MYVQAVLVESPNQDHAVVQMPQYDMHDNLKCCCTCRTVTSLHVSHFGHWIRFWVALIEWTTIDVAMVVRAVGDGRH